MSEQVKAYKTMVANICELYGTHIEKEHDLVTEFFEGEIPLFKLVYVPPDEKGGGFIMVSFHLDLTSTYAIQWYLRLQDLCPPLRITHCYYLDDAGQTHIGDDAEIIKMYKLEQEIISDWIRENQETDEEALDKPVIADRTPTYRVYTNKEAALKDFNRITKSKKDENH